MLFQKHLFLLSVILIFSVQGQLKAQDSEIDFSYGAHSTKVKFIHDSPVNTDSKGFENFNNSNFTLGFTSHTAKQNWFLRTEFGLLNNNTFISATYKVDEGLGSFDVLRLSYLNNQRLYLGLLPEFRYTKSVTTLKFAAGALFCSDLSNTYTTLGKVLTPKDKSFGLKFKGGFHIKYNGIGAGLNISYLTFMKSEIENIYHPKISYSMIAYNFSIIHIL